jgi:hypothetical protein
MAASSEKQKSTLFLQDEYRFLLRWRAYEHNMARGYLGAWAQSTDSLVVVA